MIASSHIDDKQKKECYFSSQVLLSLKRNQVKTVQRTILIVTLVDAIDMGE